MRQVKHTLKPHYLPIFYIPVRVIRLYDIQTSSAQCHVPNFPKLFACTGHLPIMDFVVSIHALISFFRIPVGRKSSGVFYLHTVIINGYAHRTSGFFVRPMLKNGVPSEVTLCRVEHGIDNSALANRMQEFAKSFHRRLSKADGDKEIILWMAKPSAALYRPTNASLILCQHIPTTPASHWLPKPAERKTMR